MNQTLPYKLVMTEKSWSLKMLLTIMFLFMPPEAYYLRGKAQVSCGSVRMTNSLPLYFTEMISTFLKVWQVEVNSPDNYYLEPLRPWQFMVNFQRELLTHAHTLTYTHHIYTHSLFLNLYVIYLQIKSCFFFFPGWMKWKEKEQSGVFLN